MTTTRISVASDFSRHPGGRFRADGTYSGEAFRDDVLIPAVESARTHSGTVVVVLDGVAAYASSFLEEVFGGLVRSNIAPYSVLKNIVKIKAEDPLYDIYKRLAEEFMHDAGDTADKSRKARAGGDSTMRVG